MKKVLVIGLLIPLVAASLFAQENATLGAPGSFLVVKVSDHTKEISYKVMTQQEYKVLLAEIGSEGRCWEKAMNIAEKEWKNNPETAKKSFPRNTIAQKRASISQVFTSQDKAMEKVSAIEKREADQADLDKKREEDKEKNKNRGRNKPAALVRAEQSKQQMEDQRNKLIQEAVAFFESKLAELVAEQAAKPVQFAAPPGQKLK